MEITGILMYLLIMTTTDDMPPKWQDLAMCESSLRPTVVSRTGKYHGLFQFDQRSWEYVGGTGKPSQASINEQFKRAKLLKAKQGWKAWSQCAKKLGYIS